MYSKKKHLSLFLSISFFLASLIFIQCKENQVSTEPNASVVEEDLYTSLSIMSLDSLRANVADYYLLDVRSPEETEAGKIPGAVVIDFYADDFKSNIEKLEKDRTYLIYCRSGNRSGKTAKMMGEMGFLKLFNLDGGYNDYIEKSTKAK